MIYIVLIIVVVLIALIMPNTRRNLTNPLDGFCRMDLENKDCKKSNKKIKTR